MLPKHVFPDPDRQFAADGTREPYRGMKMQACQWIVPRKPVRKRRSRLHCHIKAPAFLQKSKLRLALF
jgi:hypothetical protein